MGHPTTRITPASMSSGAPSPPQRGCCMKLFSQIVLLVQKNLTMLRRNKYSTIVQFFVMVVVIVILFMFDADDMYNRGGINRHFFETSTHPITQVGTIPVCETFAMPACTTALAIVFSPSSSASANAVQSVLVKLFAANPGVESSAARYNTSSELNAAMLSSPQSVLAALQFPGDFDFATNPSYTIQINETAYCLYGEKSCNVPWNDVQLPLQVATERAILQAATGVDYDLKLSYSRFPNPNLLELARDTTSFMGPILVQLACIANLVIMVKHSHPLDPQNLRRFFGWAVGFDAISQSDTSVVFCFFFLFYLCMAAWASWLSTFVPSMTAGYALGFVLCIGMWLFGNIINGLVFSKAVPAPYRSIVCFLLPPMIFNRGFNTLTQLSIGGKDGMRWSDIADDGYNCPLAPRFFAEPCDYSSDPSVLPKRILPMLELYEWFIIDMVIYALLAIYFDQTINTGFGRAQPKHYLFLPSYWLPSRAAVVASRARELANANTSTDVIDDEASMDSDVLSEMHRVQSGGADGAAIKVVNLKKTFVRKGCCGSGAPFTAVFRINVGIEHNSLFCLLGHNGAGKTTTFNMLSGILEPTRGDAFVLGKSIKYQLRSVQAVMGICPQHDILWPELSAQDHLQLFAGLAQHARSECDSKVAAFIQAVDLVEFALKPSRTYSGGMKRRLSVACSLIADPKVVYLDEPTTGMDPVNRRGVWDVIEKAKQGRVVVLTTHAMEEADTLGDVISIMSRGRLHCLGTALHLKNKYGTGYHFDIEIPSGMPHADILSKVKGLLPDAKAIGPNAISGDVSLSQVEKMQPLCELVEGSSADAGLQIAVSMCTLETVFIKIAEAAEDPEQLRMGSGTSSIELRPLKPMGQPPAAQPQEPVSTAGVRSIVITKNEGERVGLDLTVDSNGCRVANVYEGYAAAKSKAIFAGDMLKAVNGTPTIALSKEQVLSLIKASGNSIPMELDGGVGGSAMSKVTEVSVAAPDAVRSIVITKNEGERVGLDLTVDSNGCRVANVYEGYAAAKSKAIFAGDMLKAVNGTPTIALSKEQVLSLIKASGNSIPMELDGSMRTGSSTSTATMAKPNMATSTLPQRPVEIGESDHKGVLTSGELSFTPTPFKTQFSAVATKSKTLLKRQACSTCCFSIVLPGFFLLVYVLILVLPGLIIGGKNVVAAVTETEERAIDASMSNPNLDRVNEAYEVIQQLVVIKNGCLDDQNDRPELQAMLSFSGWAYNDLCNNLPVNRISDQSRSRMTTLRGTYGCDEDFWQYIHPLYQYARDATSGEDLANKPNVTYEAFGTTTHDVLDCDAAYRKFMSTCTLPVACPSNKTDSPNELSPLMAVYAKASEYECKAVAVETLEQYTPGQYGFMGSETYLPANVTHPDVSSCMTTSYFCNAAGASKCSGAPAFINTISPGAFTECSLATYPTSTAGIFIASNGGFTNAMSSAFECVSQAAQFCQRATLFDVCPGVTKMLKPKRVPYSFGSSMTVAQKSAFGEITHSVASLAGCTSDCYSDLLSLAPTTANGAMASFTYQQDASVEALALSLPSVSCVSPNTTAATCGATREDLDQHLFSLWPENSLTLERRRRRSEQGVVPSTEGAYQGAYHVEKYSSTEIDVTVLYNGTIRSDYGLPNGANEQNVPALIARLMASVYEDLTGYVPLKQHIMDFPTPPHAYMDRWSLAMSWVFSAVLGFMQVVITSQIVTEKQTNMREIMNMSGLGRRPFWVITWIYGFCMYMVQLIFFFIVAAIFQFEAIFNHSFIMILITFLLYASAQVSYACFASTLFASRWSALVVNFFLMVFIKVLLGWQLADRATGYGTSASGLQFLVNIVPTFAMAHISELISHAGIGTSEALSGVRLDFTNVGPDTPHPLGMVMLSCLLATFFWMVIAYYLDLTLPIGPGVKQPALFFLSRSFWCSEKQKLTKSDIASVAMPAPAKEAPEVTAERKRVLENQTDGVRVLGIHKMYPGAKRAAVVNVQFGINKNECFGLLGSNGAGKSTTIHVLCGLHPPTSGTVLCGSEALDIRTDLQKIQASMGVCSQDNLLWDDLTGPEHLRFFSTLRRVSRKVTRDHIDYWLRCVNLASAADRRKRSRSYSGGMKRRLNVANAFIGNPQLVYLDEPSTGLDPESRQQLWRAVLAARPGKSLILTTHALEEAEILCNRVGIMTFGLMRTVGTPTELRLRFDQGYKFMIAVDRSEPSYEAQADTYVTSLMPSARLVDTINGVRTYMVPKNGVQMSAVFAGMRENASKYRVKDWGLAHTTLEEVFLQIVNVNNLA